MLLSYWKLLTYGFWRRMRRLFGMCAQRNAHDAVYDARSPFHSFHVIWRSSIDTEVSTTDCGPYMGQESCASEGGGSEHKGTWIEVPGMCVFSNPCSARRLTSCRRLMLVFGQIGRSKGKKKGTTILDVASSACWHLVT